MTAAIDAGIGGVTHLFNAMGTMSAVNPAQLVRRWPIPH